MVDKKPKCPECGHTECKAKMVVNELVTTIYIVYCTECGTIVPCGGG